MRIPRVSAAEDGGSRLDSIEIDLFEDDAAGRFAWSAASAPLPISDPWTATQLNLWRHPAGHPPGRRNPPERVFLVILAGAARVEVSTGESFDMEAGGMALFEDTTGEGHTFGSADGGEVIGLVVSVTEDSPHRVSPPLP